MREPAFAFVKKRQPPVQKDHFGNNGLAGRCKWHGATIGGSKLFLARTPSTAIRPLIRK